MPLNKETETKGKEFNEEVQLNSQLSQSDDTTTETQQKYSKLRYYKTPFKPNKELEIWNKNRVYDKVEINDQNCISVRSIVTLKIINGKLQTKDLRRPVYLRQFHMYVRKRINSLVHYCLKFMCSSFY